MISADFISSAFACGFGISLLVTASVFFAGAVIHLIKDFN